MNLNNDLDKEHADLMAALREDQLDAEDALAADVMDGVYDNLSADDNLSVVMNPDDDLDDELLLPEVQDEIAREIADECQGLEENGLPKSAFTLTIEMINPYKKTRQQVAQQAAFGPILSIAVRNAFLEFTYEFKSPEDHELFTMATHLKKNDALNAALDQNEDAEEVPILTLVIVPITAYGSLYMSAQDPVSWSLHTDELGQPPKKIKMLFRAEDVHFYAGSDFDMGAVTDAVMQEDEEAAQNLLEAEENEEQRLQRLRERNQKVAEYRTRR